MKFSSFHGKDMSVSIVAVMKCISTIMYNFTRISPIGLVKIPRLEIAMKLSKETRKGASPYNKLVVNLNLSSSSSSFLFAQTT